MSNRPALNARDPRKVALIDRVEDRLPGPAAFVVHRGRTAGRSRTLDGMRFLEEWVRQRAERLATTGPALARRPDIDRAAPDESWTKGRIYDLARTLEIDGRSALDKSELLDAVLEVFNGSLDGPEPPIYAQAPDPIETSV